MTVIDQPPRSAESGSPAPAAPAPTGVAAPTDVAAPAGVATPAGPQRVELKKALGARIVDRITDVTGLTSSGLSLIAARRGAWSLGYWVGGRPLYLIAYGGVGVLIASWFYGRRMLDLTGRRSDVQA